MSGADYLALPALSSSLARILLADSPAHAWHASPWLNPAYQPDESDAFDLGKAVHAYLLEGVTAFAIIDKKDWKTKAAREARDDVRASGKTPLLVHRWEAVQAMGWAARDQLARHPDPIPLTDGRPEEVLTWDEDGIRCKARLDWFRHDMRTCEDLKTTSTSAHPSAWSRTLFASGYDIQEAFYRRGIKRVYGVEPEFRFVVVEVSPPYAVSVIALDPEAQAFADTKVTRAIEIWRRCLETNTWPGYPARTAYAELPGYAQAQWLERSYYDQEVSR